MKSGLSDMVTSKMWPPFTGAWSALLPQYSAFAPSAVGGTCPSSWADVALG